jgi:hypothetical protein
MKRDFRAIEIQRESSLAGKVDELRAAPRRAADSRSESDRGAERIILSGI